MKTKKIISFLLSFAMVLGMLPGIAFAQQYEQLYSWMGASDYQTSIELATGGSMTIVFAIDSGSSKTTIGSDYVFNCPAELGTLNMNSDGAYVWAAAASAATGQITATKDGVTYAINATVTENNGNGGGQTSYAEGFYTAMANDGTLSGFIDCDPNDSYRYTIPYTSGAETTAYYYNENIVSFTISGNGLSMVKVSDNIYAVTLAAGNSGTIDGDIQYVNTTGGNPGFPVTFTDGTHQLYFFWDTGDYRTEVSHIAGGEEMLLVFTIAQDENTTDGSFTYGCTEGLGTVQWDSTREAVLWTSGNSAATGQITATKDGVTYAINATVTENNGNGGGQGGNDPFELIGMISDSKPTTSDMTCTGNGWLPNNPGTDHTKSAVTAFKLPESYNDKTTYYLGIIQPGATIPHTGSGWTPPLQNGDYEHSYFDIAFFVEASGGQGYLRVVDSVTLANIKEAFGNTLKLEVKGLTHEPFNYTAPETFPALYTARGDDHAIACTAMELGAENYGAYAIIVSGTVNGKSLCSRANFLWAPQTEIVFEPTGSDVIDEINTYLTTVNPTLRAVLTINLPAGTHEGCITVPAALRRLSVNIHGDDSGNHTISIRGGIQSDGYAVEVYNIAFFGAASGGNERPAKNDADNVALSGNGFIFAHDCRFEGYDIAIDGENVLKFAIGSTFENNNTAVLLNTTNNKHHRSNLDYCTFIDNETAIDFNKIPRDVLTTTITMTGCCFVDNDTDIRNDIKKNIFLPGCYFAYTVAGVEEVRECVFRSVANGIEDKKIHYYPQADSRDCNSYIYDTTFYQHDIVLSNDFAKTFPIPVNALDGGKFTVMNGETELATITYAEVPAAQTYSLRNRASGAFDATVEVVRTGNTRIDITLQEIPAGKMPTVSVPCSGWSSAAVTDPDGNPLDATVSGGYVSFVAAQGGTYVIANTTPVPVNPPIVIPTVSDTSTEKRTNADGSTTTIVTDKKTGTVTETTEYSDGAVLEIVTDKNGKQEITVSVPENTETTVEIPVKTLSAGTVAVIVRADGTEEVVSHSVPGENGLLVTLDESAVLKIVDNAKVFSDVKDKDWFSDAVDFVSARGIMSGTGVDQFGHDSTTTRAMIWTMLARLDGIDTDGGANWYEKGMDWAVENDISDGSNASGAITREQLAVMLWRLSGSPKVYESSLAALGRFADGESVSSYAQEAMAWAVANGILGGMGDGTLNPGGNATRAQVAQIMMNYMMNI